MMYQKPLAVAITLACSLSSFAALAATASASSDATDTFDEVLVSATRVSEKSSDSSRSVAVVDEAQLASQQPQSVPAALKHEANIEADNGPRASAQGVSIRGLSGQRVVQTIDGARQNTSAGHRGTYLLDPELVQGIEVLKGPASSLWGSGAIGGVVAQRTKSASDLLEEGQQLGGYARAGYADNGQQLSTSGALYGQGGDAQWLVNGNYSDGDNIELGNGQELTNSASRSQGGLAKVDWQLTAAQQLTFSGRSRTIDELVPSNPAANVSSSVPLVRRNTTDNNLTLGHRWAPAGSSWLDADSTLYWNQTRYDEERVVRGQQDQTDFDTLGFSLVNRSTVAGSLLTYGVDGYRDEVQTVRDDSGQEGQRPDNLDGEANTYGSFLQARLPLGASVALEPALRYDHFSNKSHNLAASSSDSAWSPSLGASWQTRPWLTLSARYDEAFRAPSVEEMYSSGSHYCIPPIPGMLPGGMCNTFVPNAELQAEKAANKGLKADLRFAQLAGDDELAVTLDLFRNDVDQFIEQQVYDPLMGIPGFEQHTRWVNVDKARLTGFELDSRYRINATRVGLALGKTKGEDRSDGGALYGIPATKAVFDLSQGLWQEDLTLGTRVTYVASQDQVPADNAVAEYDSYALWDLYLSWQPAMGSLSGLRVDLAVDNLTDRYYRQAWQTLYEQGRNARLGLRYSF